MSFLSNLLGGQQPQPSTHTENGHIYKEVSDRYSGMDRTVITPAGGMWIDNAGQSHFGYGSCQEASDTRNYRGY